MILDRDRARVGVDHPSLPFLVKGLSMTVPFKTLLIALTWLVSLVIIQNGQAADSNVLTVSASVLSKSVCKFNTKTSALDFGNLDPGSASNVTAVTTIGFKCVGSAPMATFLITQDDGLNETGPGNNRMQHATVLTEFLPYTLSLSPTSATVPKNSPQTLTVTGTVIAADYQNAFIGSYADSVVITIDP